MSKQKNVPKYFKISSHFPFTKFCFIEISIFENFNIFANNIIGIEAAKGTTTSLRYSIANYFQKLLPNFQELLFFV
jgi:hypothetical protein